MDYNIKSYTYRFLCDLTNRNLKEINGISLIRLTVDLHGYSLNLPENCTRVVSPYSPN